MKNFTLMVYTIILFILCFLNNWYKDDITNNITFIIPILFDIILFFSFILLITLSIRNLKEKKKKCMKLFPFVGMFLIAIISFYDFRLTKTKLELSLYTNERLIIIQKVKNDEFSYYHGKNIKLPIYKKTSSDGQIYVYQNNEEQVIGFWVFRGLLSKSIELIYSSTDESIIYKNKENNKISKIIKLKENWYYVITKY